MKNWTFTSYCRHYEEQRGQPNGKIRQPEIDPRCTSPQVFGILQEVIERHSIQLFLQSCWTLLLLLLEDFLELHSTRLLSEVISSIGFHLKRYLGCLSSVQLSTPLQ